MNKKFKILSIKFCRIKYGRLRAIIEIEDKFKNKTNIYTTFSNYEINIQDNYYNIEKFIKKFIKKFI